MAASNGDGQSKQAELELFEAHALILHQTFAVAGSFSLKCAVQLGLPDIIHKLGHPAMLSELASAASVPPEREPMLRRLMRLLVRLGVFGADGDGAYRLTPFSKLLLRDGSNMSAYVLSLLDEAMVKPYFHLCRWLQLKGEPISSHPFMLAHRGQRFWEAAVEWPELNVMFNEAMACNSLWTTRAIVMQLPEVFRGLRSLVDVGGGTGTAARIIREAFPEIKCTVYDLPHVVATMPEIKGVEAVGGDMFKQIPPAQTVLLKNVLHDWGDEDCVKILLKCKDAIARKEEGGKVIMIDIVRDPQVDDPKVLETHLFLDITLMTGNGGKERGVDDWKKIFHLAGFNDYKIHTIHCIYSLIELYP